MIPPEQIGQMTVAQLTAEKVLHHLTHIRKGFDEQQILHIHKAPRLSRRQCAELMPEELQQLRAQAAYQTTSQTLESLSVLLKKRDPNALNIAAHIFANGYTPGGFWGTKGYNPQPEERLAQEEQVIFDSDNLLSAYPSAYIDNVDQYLDKIANSVSPYLISEHTFLPFSIYNTRLKKGNFTYCAIVSAAPNVCTDYPELVTPNESYLFSNRGEMISVREDQDKLDVNSYIKYLALLKMIEFFMAQNTVSPGDPVYYITGLAGCNNFGNDKQIITAVTTYIAGLIKFQNVIPTYSLALINAPENQSYNDGHKDLFTEKNPRKKQVQAILSNFCEEINCLEHAVNELIKLRNTLCFARVPRPPNSINYAQQLASNTADSSTPLPINEAIERVRRANHIKQFLLTLREEIYKKEWKVGRLRSWHQSFWGVHPLNPEGEEDNNIRLKLPNGIEQILNLIHQALMDEKKLKPIYLVYTEELLQKVKSIFMQRVELRPASRDPDTDTFYLTKYRFS